MKLTGKHILLLLLYSPGETNQINEVIKGRTRLTKMMFLFDKELKKDFLRDKNFEIENYPIFEAWHYGPFSKDVFTDLEFFINNGYIEQHNQNEELSEIEYDEHEHFLNEFLFDDEIEIYTREFQVVGYTLTDEPGIKYVENELLPRITSNQKTMLCEFKSKTNSVSLEALLRYTYRKYRDYTDKSVIADKIFGY